MSDSPPPFPNKPLPSGKIVGDYKIGMPLGTGGMADVYYAIDQRLDRPVALKVLRATLAADETHQQRFLQEAKAAAGLVHPNIVQIYNVGQDGDIRYIAQEYIPGTNLRQYMAANFSEVKPVRANAASVAQIKDRQLPIQETLSILLQVLAALGKAASAGVVHRDIKPENIMLTPDGQAKVADFGLARITMGDDPRLTSAGTTLGTPMYMSPEQLEGGPVDVRSDLYSLGVTLFHMLYGQPPFSGDTPLALAMQHVKADVPDTSSLRKSVPASIESLVRRLLSKSPDQRFDNPEQILDYLHEQRKSDLGDYWPDRVVPIPGAAIAGFAPMQATQQLQALLRKKPRSRWFSRAFWSVGTAVWLIGLGSLTYSVTQRETPTAEQLFPITEALYNNVPRQESVKLQYEWALVEKDPKYRFAKWEAVEKYFPKSNSPINQLYVGLSNLQLARTYKEVGDKGKAAEQLATITVDATSPALLQSLAWLELAAVEHAREDKAQVKKAVENALQLREKLSNTDVEQLEQAVQTLPSEIGLYWAPTPAS